MDEEDEDLLVGLCTRIGIIMEDASFVALTIRGTEGAEREAAIAEVTRLPRCSLLWPVPSRP
jgi:hypothetical protein